MRVEESYSIFQGIRGRMVELLNVMDNPYPRELLFRNAIDGSIKFGDCHIVQQLLEQNKPQTCLEIGSFLGFSTRWLLESSKNWGMHVTAVDPNMRHRVFDNPRWMVEGMNARFMPDRLEIISGFFGAHGYWNSDYERFQPQRSREWAKELISSRQEINGSWNKSFDCIFIDAIHTYEAVMDGFRHAMNLLNPGGTILFHDAIQWPGVTKALTEIRNEFEANAKMEIIDGSTVYNHPSVASEIMKHADGIGYFKIKNPAPEMAQPRPQTASLAS